MEHYNIDHALNFVDAKYNNMWKSSKLKPSTRLRFNNNYGIFCPLPNHFDVARSSVREYKMHNFRHNMDPTEEENLLSFDDSSAWRDRLLLKNK
jgi:hypothetical protein